MESANRVVISKIKVKKDKLGLKTATVEITRVVEEGDKFTPDIEDAIMSMSANKKIDSLKLSEIVGARNLLFFSAPDMPKPSDMVAGIEIGSFKLRREQSDVRDVLVISFEFTMELAHAKQWILPSIGDDVMLVVEDMQTSLPGVN